MISAVWHRGSIWPWLALLFTSALVIAAIAWEVWPRTVDLSLVRPRPRRAQAPSAPAAEPVRVRLFFPNTAKANLVEEERVIPRRSVLADAVRAVLQELTRTSGPGTIAPFPPTAQLRQVFLDQFGILYLDFNTGIETLLAGDETRARVAVSAVALSLATNFSQVKRVQFLIDGHDWAAQVGTVDLRRPLQPRFPEEESAPVLSKPPDGNP
ncbi:MAG: GerMN domain-containing protein [Rudaea sp.]